jgi:LysM repeat protein
MWYIVQPRDTLSLISQRFAVPLQVLMQANSIFNGVIYIGQWLFIPLASRAIQVHIYQVGETLESIAKQYNTTKQAIMQLNDLKNDLIDPGTALKIEVRHTSTIPYFNLPKLPETNLSVQNLPTDNSVRPDPKQHVVDLGDTLDSIAQKYNTTKQAIMKENGLGSEEIWKGRTLKITTQSRKIQYPVDQRPSSPSTISPYKVLYMSFLDDGLQAMLKVWKAVSKKEPNAFFFVSKLEVTAAGAPKAFHRNSDLAYEFLKKAGIEGYWWGLVTDSSGNPIVQGANDPAPGYYISKTALSDCRKPVNDQTRYLDATVIPYIALPARHMMEAKIGDLCLVINTVNNKICYAIVGAIEPDNSIGIGSIALAEKLEIPSSPKTGGVEDGILYIIFVQSGDNACTPKTPQQITEQGEKLFEQWGGMKQVKTLFDKFPLSYKTNS